LRAVTAAPDWVTVALQPFVIRWSPPYVQVTVHPLTAASPAVTRTAAVKPPVHALTW
jgi:hypothetical protein